MQRDQGPQFNLGFGVNSRQHLRWDEGETEGIDPESGVIAKAFRGHPVMRFFAASAATMVGMVAGGNLIRKGGIKLAYQMQESGVAWQTNLIKDVRKTQQILDEWQGVTRTLKDDNPTGKLFIKGPDGKIQSGSDTVTLQGFFFSKGAKERAQRLGLEQPDEWLWRDEIQQRMVAQARRLPYELPAAYFVQRGLTDNVFGSDENKKHINWYNPVDVITDFVTQSTKNLAFMITPFEMGAASGKHLWRKAMTYGDDMVNLSPRQQRFQTGSVMLRTVLTKIGTDATDLLNAGVKFSAQSTGAFSSAVNEARQRGLHLTDYLHKTRHGLQALDARMAGAAMDKATRKRARFDFLFRNKSAIGAPGEMADIYNALPGPFRGLGAGIRAAKSTYRRIGEQYDDYAEYLRLGASRYNEIYKTNPAKLKNVQAMLGSGSSSISELAGRLQSYGNGGARSGNKAFGQSEFHKIVSANEYSRLLARELRNNGVNDKVAHKFSSLARLSLPGSADDEFNLAARVGFGKGDILPENESDWMAAFKNRLSMFESADRDAIAGSISKSIKNVDVLFRNKEYRRLLDSKIRHEWNLVEGKIAPKFASGFLSHGKLPYEDFYDLNASKVQYLRRKTAESTGLTMADPTGRRISEGVVNSHLIRRGFDPGNPEQLKAFLVGKKHISAPWTKGGRNIFGLKALTVSEGLNRGYFATDDRSESQIANIISRLAVNDPVSDTMGLFKMKGVYQSSSGQILDTTMLRRRATRFLDKVADDFKIPLIQTKPLSLFGYDSVREARERAILHIGPGNSIQPFIGKSQQQANADFYVWMRSKGMGTRGRVTAVGADKAGIIGATEIKGLFRPGDTSGSGLFARQTRIAIGDLGERRYSDDTRYGRMKNAFDVNPNQSNSILGYIKRFSNRKLDINNPTVMAEFMSKGQIKVKGSIYRLQNNRIVDESGSVLYGEADVAKAFQMMGYSIRRNALSTKVLSEFEADSSLSGMFGYRFTGSKPVTFTPGPMGETKISDLTSATQLEEAARLVLREDARHARSLAADEGATLRRAQRSLLWRHLDNSGSDSYWDSTVKGPRNATISTRQDEFRQSFYSYLGIRDGILGSGREFQYQVPKLMNKLGQMRSRGQISQAEFTEARAALLSMQIDNQSFFIYSRENSPLQNALGVFSGLISRESSKDLLGTVASGQLGLHGSPWRNAATAAMRRRFSPAPAQFEGVEYNPFGNTSTVFVPTFRTAWQQERWGAVSSVVGGNTWSNPAAFSGASVPVSHMFERMNRYFSAASIGIDPTKYSGPLDFYARGMVGKRVLPIVAGGTVALTADRTIGGFMNPKDEYGDRVYSPYFVGKAATGLVHAQAAISGIMPWGMGYEEKLDQLKHGEVAIRSGRFWPLGNTPFKGGRIQYYRPSWYRRLQAGHLYTDQTFGSPLERLAFGYDFSPLRPLDPYRFERKHYDERPYPVTGEYFTGPWGPITTALNMTFGKVLKPQVKMHKDEVEFGLSQILPVGEYGAYIPGAPMRPQGSSGGDGPASDGIQSAMNLRYAGAASPRNTARNMVNEAISTSNAMLSAASGVTPRGAVSPVGFSSGANTFGPGSYGIPVSPGSMTPRIIAGVNPQPTSEFGYQGKKLAHEFQELFGIYGFAFGTIREQLGLGSADLSDNIPRLTSSAAAYGSSRQFWDLNLGGLGDAPLPIEGNLANLEFSEIARRFIPKERTGTQFINPIPNQLGMMHPWLPGSEYFMNFKNGDPYTAVQEGEMRLPGMGYERFNTLHSDMYGKYGLVDQHKILGDVAPWSDAYRMVDRAVGMGNNAAENMLIEQTRQQVDSKARRHEFHPYKYKYSSPEELGLTDTQFALRRFGEAFAHRNTPFHTKFLPHKSALEDWERENVYGATFPQWSHPIEDFLKPMAYNATQRNPIISALALGTVGRMFGASHEAKALGTVIGGAIGATSSIAGDVYEKITGDRFIPKRRRQELALEEYTDMLQYVKGMKGMQHARMLGDMQMAEQFRNMAQSTMYGVDIYNANLEQLAQALPRRKREHFREMVLAPEQEHEKILSTAGRLERRIYQAAWGRPVEARPELVDYFSKHELPNANWEGWHPNTNMNHIKVKIGQSLGLDLSQMGFFPQEVREANLVNPSYPTFDNDTSRRNVEQQLRLLLRQQGVNGDVYPVITPYPGTRLEMQLGV